MKTEWEADIVRRVGVEGTLSDVKGALQDKGYEVIDLKQEEDLGDCACCVISGQDKDVMGMATTNYTGSVINAHGMNAEEICQQVDQKMI